MTEKKKKSAETLQQNRSRRGSKPCCFCYSPSSPSFREYPKNPIPSQKILKLDNPKALECRILAKLFAATVCAADGREIFGNRGKLKHCPCARVCVSLFSLVIFFFLWLPKFRVLFKFLNIHILNAILFILFYFLYLSCR
jgi:hypothetical protein